MCIIERDRLHIDKLMEQEYCSYTTFLVYDEGQ